MGRAGWVYVRGRRAVTNFLYLNCGFLPRSSGDSLVSGAHAHTRKRLTGRLCWSIMVSRVARIRGPNVRSEPARSHTFLASGPRAMATPWDPRGQTFVASPYSRNVNLDYFETFINDIALYDNTSFILIPYHNRTFLSYEGKHIVKTFIATVFMH